MNKGLQWTIGISVVLLVLVISFSIVVPYVFPNTPYGLMEGYGMMGGYGGGMMRGGYGLMPFGGFMLLGPVLFIGLIVLGVIVLVRTFTVTQPAVTPRCAHCSQPLQAGWKACPYCGEKV